MKLLIEKLEDKINEYKALEIRKLKENEELINKKRLAEERAKEFSHDISQFQLENLNLPEQLKNIENHITVSTHERRKLNEELKKVLEE